ncbi:MAG: hypothetical protein ACYTHK_13530 [Planctomycetota bacterium]|jgi:hypothetical protein
MTIPREETISELRARVEVWARRIDRLLSWPRPDAHPQDVRELLDRFETVRIKVERAERVDGDPDARECCERAFSRLQDAWYAVVLRMGPVPVSMRDGTRTIGSDLQASSDGAVRKR